MTCGLRRPTAVLLIAALAAVCPAFAEDPLPPPVETVQAAALSSGEEKVTLDYRDADLTTVLRSLSYSYNLNLVTSSDIKGKITVTLRDVTVDEALDAVLSANGLTWSRKGNVIYVNPGGSEGAALVSEPIRLDYLKALEAQDLVRKGLSPKGDVKVDESSNSLVVTDFPGNIDRIRKLLDVLDTAPQQVLIEAKIIDITSKDLRNLGITWNAEWQPAGSTKGIFNRDTRFQEKLEGTFGMAGTSSTLSGGQFVLDALTFKGLSITATVDALVQDQKANLLASPSIAVLNNQEARIVIGEKVPFKERTQTTTGTTETTRFIDVGTTLRVTPAINTDGYITMRIHPEVSSVSALLDAGPRITTREADTTVRIKEGETVVIAGLIKQEDNRTKSGIPVVGQLPVLDYVFGSRSKDQTQTELAVFITPRIIRSREEMQALAINAAREEVFVTVPTAGEMAVVFSLFDKAQLLERGAGLESRRKPRWARVRQALNLYDHIATGFPDSPKAPEALYRSARLRSQSLHQYGPARANLQDLLQDYPESPLAPSAKRLLRHVERKIERGNKPAKKKTAARSPSGGLFP